MVRLTHVTFACDDPQRLAEFWAAVLGYEAEAHGKSCVARDPRGDGVQLLFNRMPKSATIEVPIHLDVNAPDREAAVQRILALGARGIVTTKHETIGPIDETFTIMRDPEGNGFCVQGPDPRKPHAYIGNITFSSASPKDLAAFWSTALGWPKQVDEEDFLQMLRDAHIDPGEFETYDAVVDPERKLPRLLFQRREKSRPDSYPLHLDLAADDRERETDRLLQAGATIVEEKHDDARAWTVLRDPEGNPFCVA